MAVARAGAVLQFIRKLGVRGDFAQGADGELLGRFVNRRDDEAFAAIVRRHGPMVLRVCLQILDDEHDAEDAFQATFLVLSCKASSIKKQRSLGSWLFGVAHHAASELKRKCARRRCHESKGRRQAVTDPLSTLTLREAQVIVNEELARLPQRYQAPLVLCSLEGLTRDEAAKQLGVPLGTLKDRLEQARKVLRARLDSRGLTVTGTFVASVVFEQMASAAMPAGLVKATVQAATALAAGSAPASVATVQIATLTEGLLRAMMMSKLKAIIAVVLVLGIIATGTTGLCCRMAPAQGAQPAVEVPQKQEMEAFTAWGKEAGGLQAGLGYRPGQHRTYRAGETVTLVVRVRNVSQEAVKFQCLPEFVFDAPAVTDRAGKPVQLTARIAKLIQTLNSDVFTERQDADAALDALGSLAEPLLRSVLGGKNVPLESRRRIERLLAKLDAAPIRGWNNAKPILAPGKEMVVGDVQLPAAVLGTGRFNLHYEPPFAKTAKWFWLDADSRLTNLGTDGRLEIDRRLKDLGTGKLELEIKSREESR